MNLIKIILCEPGVIWLCKSGPRYWLPGADVEIGQEALTDLVEEQTGLQIGWKEYLGAWDGAHYFMGWIAGGKPKRSMVKSDLIDAADKKLSAYDICALSLAINHMRVSLNSRGEPELTAPKVQKTKGVPLKHGLLLNVSDEEFQLRADHHLSLNAKEALEYSYPGSGDAGDGDDDDDEVDDSGKRKKSVAYYAKRLLLTSRNDVQTSTDPVPLNRGPEGARGYGDMPQDVGPTDFRTTPPARDYENDPGLRTFHARHFGGFRSER